MRCGALLILSRADSHVAGDCARSLVTPLNGIGAISIGVTNCAVYMVMSKLSITALTSFKLYFNYIPLCFHNEMPLIRLLQLLILWIHNMEMNIVLFHIVHRLLHEFIWVIYI